MVDENEITRKINEFDKSFDIAERVERRKLRQSFLNHASNLIDQATIDAQWGDLYSAAMHRMRAQMYLDMANNL